MTASMEGSLSNSSGLSSSNPPTDFLCDICRSPHVINPLRTRKSKVTKNNWSRKMIDSITNKVLSLCNACGLRLYRAGKITTKEKLTKVITDDERTKYLKETNLYIAKLLELTNNPAVERLVCPNVKKKLCQCIENFVASNSESDTIAARGLQLLNYHQEACKLRLMKPSNQLRRSLEYQNFILDTRQFLKNEGFCEQACQRILVYSNNFLHKKLKSTPHKTSRLVKKSSKESLKSIEDLSKIQCCKQRCTKLATTYPNVITVWRRNAALNRISARRTLAQMLIPSAAGRPNCVNFLKLVTGCSSELICKVSKQMLETGGETEPPEHGLKLSWQQRRIIQNQKQKTNQK